MIARPSSACSGGSKVFSALMPGASADSIVHPGERRVQPACRDLDLGQFWHVAKASRAVPCCAVPERLLIVGGDAAGMSAASIARRRDPDLEIVACERGPYTSYSACGIPYYVGGLVESADRLVSRSPEEHRANGIDVRMRTEVTALDLAARTATLFDHAARREDTEPFDRLVLATGARAAPPPIPGADAVEPARTVEAGERLRSALERGGSRAVIVGAGYIGLEMAENLLDRGMAVTIVEQADQVFGTLDADMAAHVQDGIEAHGADVMLSTAVQEILLDDAGRPRAVRTAAASCPPTTSSLGTGAQPEVALAAAAGLALGDSGGAAHRRRPALPGHDGIFAAGDCVESRHRVTGAAVNIQLGTHANKQGRIAGVNATGGDGASPASWAPRARRSAGTRSPVPASASRGGRRGDRGDRRDGQGLDARGVLPGRGADLGQARRRARRRAPARRADRRRRGRGQAHRRPRARHLDGLGVEELALLDLAYAPPFAPVYDPVLVAARAAAKAVEGG